MKKLILTSIFLLLSANSFAKYSTNEYAMVMFFGMGAYGSKTIDEQTEINDQLRNGGVERLFYASHSVSKSQMKKVIKEVFECNKGVQRNENLKGIVMGMSWGARNSYEFSKMYQKMCGRKLERAYMLDGIQKIAGQFKETPIANICKNYYKTNTPIRGRALENCENHDFTTRACTNRDGSISTGMQCHQQTLKAGYMASLADIAQNALWNQNL